MFDLSLCFDFRHCEKPLLGFEAIRLTPPLVPPYQPTNHPRRETAALARRW